MPSPATPYHAPMKTLWRTRVRAFVVGILTLIAALGVAVWACVPRTGDAEAVGGLEDWMGLLPDTAPLAAIAIPGAHNAGSAGMPWFAACQNLAIPDLLRCGTRCLDLRVRLRNGVPVFFHGPATGDALEPALVACRAFLLAHPTETLILDFHHFRDGAEAATHALVERHLGDLRLPNPGDAQAAAFLGTLTLGQARGRCLIVWGGAGRAPRDFARDDDRGSHPDRPFHSYYDATAHTQSAEVFLTEGLPVAIARQRDLPGLTVLQAQPTDAWGIRGPRWLDRSFGPALDALLRDWPHPRPNILLRDFVSAPRNALLLSLNPPDAFAPERLRPVLEQVQRACFDHFWRYGNDDPSLLRAGMVTDTSSRKCRALAVGGSGFGVMAFLIGAERDWISRTEALARVRETVRFLAQADRYHGVWPHWLDREGQTLRFGDQIKAGDLVETSFLMMGLLCAQRYFDGDTPEERALREAIDRLREEVEWDFFAKDGNLWWLWESTTGRHTLPLTAYNEALVTWVLAAGSPTHAIDPAVYRSGWLQDGRAVFPKRAWYGHPYPLGWGDRGGPLFLSHYSFLGLDPKALQDNWVDYFQNGLRHTLINRHYCLREAPKAHAYDAENWGLTACAGPGNRPYLARCPARDDGVVAPTAALSSIAYAPYFAAQVLLRVANDPTLMTPGGPVDAYVPATGETAPHRIAIDQGPIVVMVENYRSGLLWRLFMAHPDVRRGLTRLGFRAPRHPDGFPYALPDADGVHDLLRHPDLGCYLLDYSLAADCERTLLFQRPDGTVLHRVPPAHEAAGTHTLRLPPEVLPPGAQCQATLLVDGTTAATVRLRLR